MDAAVGLVQAYLRINGFFTVTEFPIVAQVHGLGRTLTDVDVLALRFPGAGRWMPGVDEMLPTDPVLTAHEGGMLMIIGEVKEGKSRMNPTVSRRDVVETVIRRFGCCSHDPKGAARKVVENGFSDTAVGSGMSCRVRWIVFGGTESETHHPYHVVSLRHVAEYLNEHIEQYPNVYLKAESKDPALDLMALLVKVGLRLKPTEDP